MDSIIQDYFNEYEKDTNYFNFFENAFKVEYDKHGNVKFIEIDWGMKSFFNCECLNYDVFNTKADALVKSIRLISDHEKNTTGGTEYLFTNIGLSLWRSSVFREEFREEDWFKDMCVENQEQELRYSYFQTVAVYPNDGLYYKGLI